MRIAVTGSRGFVGSALCARLEELGHEAVRLLRPGVELPAGSGYWNPENGTIDSWALEGLDAVVHLAGAGVGEHRWTRSYKETIRRSRVEGTRLIVETLTHLAIPPGVLVSASAIGWYGDRGDEVLTEESAPGEGFRAEVCREWEAATAPAASAGIRVAKMRFGIVLGPGGGFLGPLMLPARLGLGVRFGDGSQFLSWITCQDTVAAILKTIEDETLSGAVNTTSPNPVRNKEFARELSRTLGRPALGHLPTVALEIAAGKRLAREVLLSSQRAVPNKLLAAGFAFQHTEIGDGLSNVLSGDS